MLQDCAKTISESANQEYESFSLDIVIVFFLASTPYGKMFILHCLILEAYFIIFFLLYNPLSKKSISL